MFVEMKLGLWFDFADLLDRQKAVRLWFGVVDDGSMRMYFDSEALALWLSKLVPCLLGPFPMQI